MNPFNQIREIVLPQLDPWTVQEPTMSKEEIYEVMLHMQKNDSAKFFMIGETVFFAGAVTNWVWDVHLYTNEKDGWKLVQDGKQFTKYVFDNYPHVQRLQFETIVKKLCSLAKRCGWNKEGTRKEAFMTSAGIMIDSFMWGITRKDFENKQSKESEYQNNLDKGKLS